MNFLDTLDAEADEKIKALEKINLNFYSEIPRINNREVQGNLNSCDNVSINTIGNSVCTTAKLREKFQSLLSEKDIKIKCLMDELHIANKKKTMLEEANCNLHVEIMEKDSIVAKLQQENQSLQFKLDEMNAIQTNETLKKVSCRSKLFDYS